MCNRSQSGVPAGDFGIGTGQCYEARQLLGWTLDTAAKRAGISPHDVDRLENCVGYTHGLFELERAYRAAGIEFADLGGFKVRLNDGPWLPAPVRLLPGCVKAGGA